MFNAVALSAEYIGGQACHPWLRSSPANSDRFEWFRMVLQGTGASSCKVKVCKEEGGWDLEWEGWAFSGPLKACEISNQSDNSAQGVS